MKYGRKLIAILTLVLTATSVLILPAKAAITTNIDIINANQGLKDPIVFTMEESAEPIVRGNPVRCENLTLLDGGNYYCILLDTIQENENGVLSYPERETTKTFLHAIVDRDGDFVANLTVTVKGIYSQADNYAEITSVSGAYSDQQISGLPYSVSYNGNTAQLNVLLNGLKIGSVSYKLYTNGSLQQI